MRLQALLRQILSNSIIATVTKRQAFLFISVIVFVLSVALVFLEPLRTVQWKIEDLFFRARPVSTQITIIAIDDKSLSPEGGLGRFRDWPRSYYADLIRKINPFKPAVVAFDLDFRNPSQGMSGAALKQITEANLLETVRQYQGEVHPDDADFNRTLSEGGPVVLTSSLLYSERLEEDATILKEPAGVAGPIFKGDKISVGYKDVLRDRDGVLRRFAPKVRMNATDLFNFPATIVKSSAQAASLPDTESGEQIRIAYNARPFSYTMIPFVDVLKGSFDPKSIEGKIVLVGATASILQDIHSTPTSRDFMAGVEVNANMVQQLMEGRSLNEQGLVSLIVLLALISFGATLAFLKLSLRGLLITFGAAVFLYPVAAFALYQQGMALNVVYPEMALVSCAIAVLWYRNKTEFREKAEIKRAFAHYVSPVVVDELAKNPDSLKLGGSRKQITVLFSDIVGFTTLSERLSPEDTVALLNDYLTAMTEVIFSHGGTLDKYQGDAIMALFGAPLDDEHHAVNAGQAALGMRRALVGLHEKWNTLPELPFKDELIQLDFRVGMATGPAVIGNVGSEKRFDYTAIGDIVNLGSRLESINRKYGTHILVDKTTFITITNNHNPFVFRKLDTVRVKGKRQETELFEIVTFLDTVTAEVKTMLDDFENGRILYTQRNFMDARQYFESALQHVPDDGPSRIFLNRCNFFIRKPPSLDWSAVIELTEK